MTAPALAAGRFCAACLIGMLLGLFYDFLRPLRPRLTVLTDLLFLTGLWIGWLYLGFAICRGDLRFGYTAGLGLGFLFWAKTVSRLFRPIFAKLWFPVKKFFLFLQKSAKKLFASGRKKVTIESRSRRQRGGKRHAKAYQAAQPGSHQVSPQLQFDKDRGSVRSRAVPGGTSGSAPPTVWTWNPPYGWKTSWWTATPS